MSGMFEFLHIVIYIPNPRIIAAKSAKGTRRRKFVFLPMNLISILSIKLSQYYSTIIVNVPMVFGS